MCKQMFLKCLRKGVTLIALLGLLFSTAPAAGATKVINAAPAIPAGRTVVRWSIGLGSGLDPSQIPIEQEVVDDFNASQDEIYLVPEYLPWSSAYDILATQMASGDAPDIIGPAGWVNSENYHGEWLDLAPYIAASSYDTSKFDTSLVKMYQTDEGWIALPFVVFPSAMYYNTKLFTDAGLNPPPANYGDKYLLPSSSTPVDWNWDTVTKVAKLLTLDANGKHSGQTGFDASKIVQYGFSFGWEFHPNYWGTFMSNGGQLLHGSPGAYSAQIPPLWKDAWQWVYNGIWGAEPYIPNADVFWSDEYYGGNVFASGKIGMSDSPQWYMYNLFGAEAFDKFDFGAMPVGLDGAVAGRMDADTFRIWKGSPHPEAAFKALTYLIDTGIQKMVMGSPERNGIYVGLPAQTSLRGPYIDMLKTFFPSVTNWDTLLAGMNYPDKPNAESFMPNIGKAWGRLQTFGDLLSSTSSLDLPVLEATLETDLTALFNQSSPPSGRPVILWSIGPSLGASPDQIPVELDVANDFNNSQDKAYLVLEVASNGYEVLAAQIAAGEAPDIAGPAGVSAASSFHGYWLNLAPLIKSNHFKTNIFTPGLYEQLLTDAGQEALPFAAYPSAIFYNPALFDAAGLNYPPAHYGEKYTLPDGSRVAWNWDTIAQVSKLLTLDANGKNATQAGFDPANILQYGFSFGWEINPNYWGSYWKSGTLVHAGAVHGSLAASVPSAWENAWEWVYNGIWGKQPYMPDLEAFFSPEFDNGSVFASGKIAMAECPGWYLGTVGDLINAGGTFQLGAMPSYKGKVAGRVDQDTFRILKSTPNRNEAFQALAYLVTSGVDKLMIGSADNPAPYPVPPALKSAQQAFWDSAAAMMPFVTADSWNVLRAGYKYIDIPNAESPMPNFDDSWNRVQVFSDLLSSTPGLDFSNEVAKLEYDLGILFNNGTSYIPALQSPVDGAILTDNRPAFDWTDVTGAKQYEIQISPNAGFSKLVRNGVVKLSSYTPATNLPAGQTLYWRVRAKFPGGNGPWSPHFTLQTAP
jgi:multiple sugar transport system substrate-binding protein